MYSNLPHQSVLKGSSMMIMIKILIWFIASELNQKGEGVYVYPTFLLTTPPPPQSILNLKFFHPFQLVRSYPTPAPQNYEFETQCLPRLTIRPLLYN